MTFRHTMAKQWRLIPCLCGFPAACDRIMLSHAQQQLYLSSKHIPPPTWSVNDLDIFDISHENSVLSAQDVSTITMSSLYILI